MTNMIWSILFRKWRKVEQVMLHSLNMCCWLWI